MAVGKTTESTAPKENEALAPKAPQTLQAKPKSKIKISAEKLSELRSEGLKNAEIAKKLNLSKGQLKYEIEKLNRSTSTKSRNPKSSSSHYIQRFTCASIDELFSRPSRSSQNSIGRMQSQNTSFGLEPPIPTQRRCETSRAEAATHPANLGLLEPPVVQRQQPMTPRDGVLPEAITSRPIAAQSLLQCDTSQSSVSSAHVSYPPQLDFRISTPTGQQGDSTVAQAPLRTLSVTTPPEEARINQHHVSADTPESSNILNAKPLHESIGAYASLLSTAKESARPMLNFNPTIPSRPSYPNTPAEQSRAVSASGLETNAEDARHPVQDFQSRMPAAFVSTVPHTPAPANLATDIQASATENAATQGQQTRPPPFIDAFHAPALAGFSAATPQRSQSSSTAEPETRPQTAMTWSQGTSSQQTSLAWPQDTNLRLTELMSKPIAPSYQSHLFAPPTLETHFDDAMATGLQRFMALRQRLAHATEGEASALQDYRRYQDASEEAFERSSIQES